MATKYLEKYDALIREFDGSLAAGFKPTIENSIELIDAAFNAYEMDSSFCYDELRSVWNRVKEQL